VKAESMHLEFHTFSHMIIDTSLPLLQCEEQNGGEQPAWISFIDGPSLFLGPWTYEP
jgi:hypothetical protein